MMTTPAIVTLNKYGLNLDTFKELLASQNGVCAICCKVPNGRWNIDHDHVKNWKKLPPEQRVKYVRGVLCWFCNRYYVGRSITVAKAENVVRYLKRYEARKP